MCETFWVWKTLNSWGLQWQKHPSLHYSRYAPTIHEIMYNLVKAHATFWKKYAWTLHPNILLITFVIIVRIFGLFMKH